MARYKVEVHTTGSPHIWPDIFPSKAKAQEEIDIFIEEEQTAVNAGFIIDTTDREDFEIIELKEKRS